LLSPDATFLSYAPNSISPAVLPQTRSGELTAPPGPLAGFKGPRLPRGREGEGKGLRGGEGKGVEVDRGSRHNLDRPLTYSLCDATAAASCPVWSQSGPECSGVTMGWLLRLLMGGPTGGRGPPTVLEFLVINFSVCLVLLSNCYIIIALYGFKFNR